MSQIVETHILKRGFFGWVFLTMFLIYNALMALSMWLAFTVIDNQYAGAAGPHPEFAQAGTAIAGTIGGTIFLVIWLAGAVILGLLALLTRGRKTVVIRNSSTVRPLGVDWRFRQPPVTASGPQSYVGFAGYRRIQPSCWRRRGPHACEPASLLGRRTARNDAAACQDEPIVALFFNSQDAPRATDRISGRDLLRTIAIVNHRDAVPHTLDAIKSRSTGPGSSGLVVSFGAEGSALAISDNCLGAAGGSGIGGTCRPRRRLSSPTC